MQGAGALGAGLAAFAEGLLSQLDGLELSAWDAFHGEDVALLVGAVLVALGLLAAGGAAGPGVRVAGDFAARGALVAGLGLGLLVTVRLLDRPGPSGLLTLGLGGWVALGGCAAMALGGTLAAATPAPGARSASPGEHDRAFSAPAAAWRAPGADAGSSVAPPPPRG